MLSDSQLTVKQGAAGSTAGTIGARLLAYADPARPTRWKVRAPKAKSRAIRRVLQLRKSSKTPTRLTGTAEHTEGPHGRSVVERQKAGERTCPAVTSRMSILFGRRSGTTGDNGKPSGRWAAFVPSSPRPTR